VAGEHSWNQAEAVRGRTRCNELVALFPQTVVEDAYGHTGYLLGNKRYAWLLVDHHGDGRLALWVKAPKGEQAALVGADAKRYFVPPYLGPSGWVGVQLDDASDPDWEEVAALLEQAWRMNAGKRLLAAFDAERG
jgi:hypothetical protein